MKKKVIISLFLMFILLSLVGCSKNEQIITCIGTETFDNDTMNMRYVISYQDNYVTKLDEDVEIISDDYNKLIEYNNDNQEICEQFNSIKHTECYSKIENGILNYGIKINFNKVDFNKMIEAGIYTFELRLKDGKIHLDNIINDYKSNGMVCK